MNEEYRISEESATEQYQQLLNWYDLDFSDAKDPRAPEKIKQKIVKAIRQGKVEIEIGESIAVVQHTENCGTLRYGQVSARARVAMDREKGESARLYAYLAALSKTEVSKLYNLEGIDLSIAELLGLLFLGV